MEQASTNSNSVLKAGAARTDITPLPGSLINGDFVPSYARFIHDPLYAKALWLQDDVMEVVIVVLDMCVIEKSYCDRVKEEIKKQAGVPVDHILICCTHTHAGGATMSLHLSPADLPYMDAILPRIGAVVLEAKHKCRPARIAFGSTDAPGLAICRRYYMKDGFESRNPVTGEVEVIKTNPSGAEQYIDGPSTTIDTQVCFVAIRGEDEEMIALLANYSLHYVGDWDSGTITADYFGYFADEVNRLLNAPGECVCMMTNGTSGDANIWDFLDPHRFPKENFRKSEIIGTTIARKVVDALAEVEWEDNAPLGIICSNVPVRVRKPTIAELDTATKICCETDYYTLDISSDTAMKKLFAREQVLLNAFPDETGFPMQAVRIGSVKIGALAGEFFSETGLALKAKFGNYFTISLANGFLGYVPPKHEIRKGGYESWRSRTSYLDEDAEELMRNKLQQIIDLV